MPGGTGPGQTPQAPRSVAQPRLSYDPRRDMRLAAFVGLAVAGRVAFLWAPNVALTYVVVFLAGVVDGKRSGMLTGFLAMLVTNLMLSGLHPILLANGTAMALIGLAGGLLRPHLWRPTVDGMDRAVRITGLASIGVFATFLFSVTTDLFGFVLQFALTPEGSLVGERALVPMLLAGLVFNLIPAVINGTLFATLVPALLPVLQRTGLATAPAARRAATTTKPVA